MRQNLVFSTKNPLSKPNPPRRLRHLDPSHSKILGTPLNETGELKCSSGNVGLQTRSTIRSKSEVRGQKMRDKN